jgi:hypothetical protein
VRSFARGVEEKKDETAHACGTPQNTYPITPFTDPTAKFEQLPRAFLETPLSYIGRQGPIGPNKPKAHPYQERPRSETRLSGEGRGENGAWVEWARWGKDWGMPEVEET